VSWGRELREGYIYGFQDGRWVTSRWSTGFWIERLTSAPALEALECELFVTFGLAIENLEEAMCAAIEAAFLTSIPDRGRGRPADVLAYFDGFEETGGALM
jgi:hypothetical protein